MKIKIKELDRTKNISFTGEEPWLEGIKKSFSNRILSPLHGSFTVDRKSLSNVVVSGALQGKVEVACSLCGDFIPWDLDEKFQVEYLNEVKDEENWEDPEYIKLVNFEEREKYPIEKDEIDLELALNDAVQLSVPDSRIKVDGAKKCLICGEDTQALPHNLTTSEHKASPFDVLKTFKAKS